MDISAGSHIRDALREAVKLAEESGETVRFSFNAETFSVEPGESYDAAKARWYEQTRREVLSPEEAAERIRREREEREAAYEEARAEVGAATEQELREAEVPWPDSEEELLEYIASLVDRPHDYGTCVYATSMAAVAAFRYVAKQLGITGFQASCADMDVLRRIRRMEYGFRLVDYSDLLYPQYWNEEREPIFRAALEENPEEWAERAREKLEKMNGYGSLDVKNHLAMIAGLASESDGRDSAEVS